MTTAIWIFEIWLAGFIVCFCWVFDFSKLITKGYTREQEKMFLRICLFSWVMLFWEITMTIFRDDE